MCLHTCHLHIYLSVFCGTEGYERRLKGVKHPSHSAAQDDRLTVKTATCAELRCALQPGC